MAPSKEAMAELIGISMAVKALVETLSSRPGIALSVYYTLFVGELVEVASVEGNFEPIMQLLKRDAHRWNLMLEAKSPEELYQIARFTADFVTNDDASTETH